MNVAFNIITAICFIALTIIAVYFIVGFCLKKSRRGRIEFIRGFKKGKCLAILLISIPLFCIGHMDKGTNFIDSFFSAVSQLVDLVVLKFGTDKVKGLMDKNLFYKITIYYCYVLVTINAIMFAASVFSQALRHIFDSWSFVLSLKKKTYIFGKNKSSVDIYKSNQDKVNKVVIVDDLKREECAELYIDKINYIPTSDFRIIIDKIMKKIKRKNFKSAISIIVNTEDDERNLEICRVFSSILREETANLNKGKDKSNYNAFLFDKISVYFFCDPKYEAICHQVVEDSYGCIHYKNKYQMIAMKFIDKYPFASFMNNEQYVDKTTALVKDDVDINVCMIGFGKTNRQIFLTSVANNQFVTSSTNRDGVELKQVKYHIFDKKPAKNNKNLNHSYYRYRNVFYKEDKNKETQQIEIKLNVDPKQYLPLPQFPAEEKYSVLDVNNPKFYSKIKEAFGKNDDTNDKKKSVNFAIIAFGSDLENIDMAHKLAEKRSEWELDNLIIFVKARKSYSGDKIFNGKDVILIGNEKNDVYNLEEITNDVIYRMAKMRNFTYRLESAVKEKGEDFKITQDFVNDIEKAADKKWFVIMSEWERESNLYACLALKSKLNLMGLDYRKKSNNNSNSMKNEKYLNKYAGDDMPDLHTYKVKCNGKSIIKYPLEFKKSKRSNLAIHEHLRWNSFMISRGFVPATREQILHENENGKDYSLRRHGNLTTFEGLREYRRIVADKTDGDELIADVIKYDYQLLDDAHWLLEKNGYEIIEKK